MDILHVDLEGKILRILVVGLGALGTVFSCLLQNDGHEVMAFDCKELVTAVQNNETRVTGIWGDHSAKLAGVTSSVKDLKGTFDLIILTVKSFDTVNALNQVKGAVGPTTRVVLAQNGFGNYEAAQALISKENLIVGRVIFGAETIAPGYSKVTVIADDVILGSPGSVIPDQEVEAIAAAINQAGVPTRASNEVLKYLWGKILYNSALNPLGAILEVNYGKLAQMPDSSDIMNKIIEEIFAVLEAMGEKIFWPDAAAYQKDFYEKLIPPTADHHASMLQDIQRGRRIEIDALNGAVVRLGQQYGVPTPVNQTIVNIVKAKEKLRQSGAYTVH